MLGKNGMATALTAIGLMMAGSQAAQAATKGTVEVVEAYDVDVYPLKVAAGQTLEIAVDGDDSTDLDLYLIDPNGRVIASDDDSLDLCLVRKSVCTSGVYRLKVVNRGCEANLYTIAVQQANGSGY